MINTEKFEKKWNSRFANLNIKVHHVSKLYIDSIIFYLDGGIIPSSGIPEMEDLRRENFGFSDQHPKIDFLFSICINKKLKGKFNDILNNLYKQYKEIYINGVRMPNYSKPLEITHEESEIKILGKDYIKMDYTFEESRIQKIITSINLIDDTVDILNKYFSINKDGNVISSSKYKEGTLVSIKNDPSGDYLINKILYGVDGIEYNISELKSEPGSEVLEFGPITKCSERLLIPNRDQRITQILDKNDN